VQVPKNPAAANHTDLNLIHLTFSLQYQYVPKINPKMVSAILPRYADQNQVHYWV